MVIIVTLLFAVLMALYFGVIRLLDSKKKEFLLFLTIYAVMILLMGCLSYMLAWDRAGENWVHCLHPIRDQLCIATYYIPPTFLIAYLLYPFKIIKRNRILIWILLGYSVLVIVGSAIINILVSFSNM
jgi:hypothetical protein